MGLAAYVLRPEGRRQIAQILERHRLHIATFLFVVGLLWPLGLADDRVNEPTRISENALMPGQVQTYFGSGDFKALNAFRNEVRLWQAGDRESRLDSIEGILAAAGIATARQHYSVRPRPDVVINGTNIYGILHAPRGDTTESLALLASWTRDRDGVVNEGGVAILLGLARYFKRWGLWSKDLIFIVPEHQEYGSQVWADAYHGETPGGSDSLVRRAGLIQAAVDLEFYGQDNRFDDIDVAYDGPNGQLSNLDLVNSAIHITKHQVGIGATVQHGREEETWKGKVSTLWKALRSSAVGVPTGSHSPLIPYRVDAISLRVKGKSDGMHDDASFGRVVEGIVRSLNNLLEHMHASYFFYLLPNTHRFVSIASYLPAALLMATGQSVLAMGRPTKDSDMLAVGIVLATHALGAAIWQSANRASNVSIAMAYVLQIPALSILLNKQALRSQVDAYRSLALGLLLGMISALNFSLGYVLAAGTIVFAYAPRLPRPAGIVVMLSACPALLHALATKSGENFTYLAAFDWSFYHCWTPPTILAIAMPAWTLAFAVVLS
ncbi:Glycosyl phosphatidyl inositol protein transamidase complex subunit [Savitreella phatthalungensis]